MRELRCVHSGRSVRRKLRLFDEIQQLVAEVTRAKALASVLGRVTVKDASGNVIDLEALAPKPANPADLVEEA